MAICFRGVLPIFFLAVVLEHAISLKYKESLGKARLLGFPFINKVRSLPLDCLVPFEIEGSASTLLLLAGNASGVLCMLVSGVELNSEQTIESLQPALSLTGAVKVFEKRQIVYPSVSNSYMKLQTNPDPSNDPQPDQVSYP